MGDHKRGSMDIEEQERAFAGFLNFCVWVAGLSIFVLIFLAVFNS